MRGIQQDKRNSSGIDNIMTKILSEWESWREDLTGRTWIVFHVLCMQFSGTRRELNMSLIHIFVFLSSFAFVCPSNFIDDVSVGGFLSLVTCPSQSTSHLDFRAVCVPQSMQYMQNEGKPERRHEWKVCPLHFLFVTCRAQIFSCVKEKKLLHPLRKKSTCRGFTREERNQHKFGERKREREIRNKVNSLCLVFR